MMVRLVICGNICCILSTSASRARRLLALEVDCDVREEAPVKKNHRIAIPPRKRTKRSCGILIVCSSAILADFLVVIYGSSKKARLNKALAAINVISIRSWTFIRMTLACTVIRRSRRFVVIGQIETTFKRAGDSASRFMYRKKKRHVRAYRIPLYIHKENSTEGKNMKSLI